MKKISFDEAMNFKNRQGYVYFSANIVLYNVWFTIKKDENSEVELNYSDQANLVDKITRRYSKNIFTCNIVWKLKKVWFYRVSLYNLYRIEILDKDWKIVDAINTHKDWVPKDIRENFNEQFRYENGEDRIIPLKILNEETRIEAKKEDG